MPDLSIADVSEFQGVIDWALYPWPAVIVRLSYGTTHVDLRADANIVGARSRCRARGWYHYLTSAEDPLAQADVFCRVLLAHGGLQPGEWINCDDEEGTGDQAPRVDAFLARCDANLREPDPAGEDWWYSGLNFALVHDLAAARGHRWIAAYQAGEPTQVAHDLWQRTDAAMVPGIAGPVDCSVFHGTVDDLISLIGGPMALDPNDPIVQTILVALDTGGPEGVGRRVSDIQAIVEAGGGADSETTNWLGTHIRGQEAALADLRASVAELAAVVAKLQPNATGLTDAQVQALAQELVAVLPGADAAAVTATLRGALDKAAGA